MDVASLIAVNMVWASVVPWTAPVAGKQGSTDRQVIDQIVSSWNELETRFSPSVVEHRFTEMQNPNTIVFSGEANRWYGKGLCYASEARAQSRADTWEVEGSNDVYSFRLVRRHNTNHYSIIDVSPHNERTANQAQWFDFRQRPFQREQTLKISRHITWPIVFSSNRLHVHQLTEVEHQGKRCLKIEFDVVPSDSELEAGAGGSRFDALPRIQSGVVYLWIDAFYVPISFSGLYQAFKDPKPSLLTWTVDYDLLENKVPIPSNRVTRILNPDDGAEVLVISDEFQFPLGLRPVTQDHFRLMGYGLPEPRFGLASFPIWLILTCSGIALCFALYAVRRFQKSK